MYLEYLQPKLNLMDESSTISKNFPDYSPNLNTPITSNFNEETGSDRSLVTPRIISSSNSNSNSNSNSGSIDENEQNNSNSSSSSARQIRKKWKEPEDIAFITTIMNNSQLLTFVEYFKPMKNFWKKISKILFQQYGYERNSRQCHDRFKVLYAKSLKVHPSKKSKQKKKKSKQEASSNLNFDPSKLSRMQYLLLPRDAQQEQVSPVFSTDVIYMWQTMFNTIENLKEQVNCLKNEVKQLNHKFYQQNKPLHNMSTSDSENFMQQH
ncbi:ASG_G0026110.mRNA.1.CDS.1 [Saccharomyces cerevisiae]|nr:ASG_G0026110.mRNA.1.CDS.1 [Saccharomyces cerevisiae]CAI4388023.1 ATM_1a_G0026410.mRNA.1.CDS.1 [Saccharomyces cerevisiae]CAI4395006.1 ALS_1a_G0027100.mRNA.1.CDS.1 [Saccharomyces cerevisiae]CAI4399178.1 CRB_1a_G0028030.mRNA.1.CDS.1 [Saccharomyces cerevisiae]CAI4876668.1 BPG_G0026590.mRNA.1.CDS.1 [Saccharomyces cerevisiae]